MSIRTDIIVDRIVQSSRGNQTRRKDKDLMRDTGGTSKGRDREPHFKPPRDDVKERYRDRRLTPDKLDKDTNENKDREVKKPNRRPQVKKASVQWTSESVRQYCEAGNYPCVYPSDLKNGQVIISKNRGMPPFICYYGEGGAGYIWGTGEEVAQELNTNGIACPVVSEVHPLDRTQEGAWAGLKLPEENYHRRVFSSLWHIFESEKAISEKDFGGQDWIRDECDRIVRTPEADEVIQRFSTQNLRPSYCAECIFANLVMGK